MGIFFILPFVFSAAATSITPTRDFWMSAGKSDSSKASTDFSSPRPQNKIIFDEMESEKDKDEPYQTGYEDGLEDIGKTTSCARTNIMTENTLVSPRSHHDLYDILLYRICRPISRTGV